MSINQKAESARLNAAGLDLLNFIENREPKLSPHEIIAVLDATRYAMMAAGQQMGELSSLFVGEAGEPLPEEIARWEDDGGAPAVERRETRAYYPEASTSAMEQRNAD